MQGRDSPGWPLAGTPHFHCKGLGFDPWSGTWDPAWQNTLKKFFLIKKKKERNCAGIRMTALWGKGPVVGPPEGWMA